MESRLGAGSTCTVPLDLPPAPTVPDGPSTDGLAGLRLLLVDDNPTDLLRRLAHGLEGSSAALGATAPAQLCSSLGTAAPGTLAVGDTPATPELERTRVGAAVNELLAAVGSGGRDGADGPPTIER